MSFDGRREELASPRTVAAEDAPSSTGAEGDDGGRGCSSLSRDCSLSAAVVVAACCARWRREDAMRIGVGGRSRGYGHHDDAVRRQITREIAILRTCSSTWIIRVHGMYEQAGELQNLLTCAPAHLHVRAGRRAAGRRVRERREHGQDEALERERLRRAAGRRRARRTTSTARQPGTGTRGSPAPRRQGRGVARTGRRGARQRRPRVRGVASRPAKGTAKAS